MPFTLDTDRIRRALPGMVQDIKTVLLSIERAAVANGLPKRSAMRYKARGEAVLAAREDWEEACEALLSEWREAAHASVDAGDALPPEPVYPSPPTETEDEQLLADYALQINAAMQAGVKARLARIAQGQHGWQGSAWIMERCFGTREEYSPPMRVEHSGRDGNPFEVVVSQTDDRNKGRKKAGLPPLEVRKKDA